MTVFDGIPFLEDAQDFFEDFYSETVGGIHYVVDVLDTVFEDFSEYASEKIGEIWYKVWEPLYKEFHEAVYLTWEWTKEIPQPWHSFLRIFLIGPALLYTTLKPLFDKTAKIVWDLIPDWLISGVSEIKEKASNIYDDLKSFIGDFPSQLTGFASDIKETLTIEFRTGVNDILGGVADWISKLLTGISEILSGAIDKMTGEFKEHWTVIFGPLGQIYDVLKNHKDDLMDIWETIADWLVNLGKTLASGAKEVMEGLWGTISELFGWVIDKIKASFGAISAALIPTKREIKSEEDVWGIVGDVLGKILVMALPFAVATIAGELVHPLKELGLGQISALLWHASAFDRIGADLIGTITYALMTLPLRYALFYWSTPRIPEEELIFPLIERGVLDKEKFIDVFKRMGYNEYWGQLYWETHWQEPQLFDLYQMLWRGLITEEEFRSWLKYIGYEPSLWDKFLELTKKIPPASDLIEFVVKEAFPLERLPEAPEEFVKYMRMQGYDEKWARAYWFVHWRMPSFEQLQEAFFRGIITLEEFQKYIVWWDYAPFARPGISKSDMEIMQELIYRMPDKLDIRFMLRWGIIDTHEAAQLFKMTGIHPDWVEKVAEANFMNLFQDERTQLRNAILSQYREGYITREEALEMLINARFTREEAQILMQAYDLNKDKDLKDLLLDYYKELLKRGEITKGKFIGDLVAQGWDRKKIEALADLLEVKYKKIDRVDETKDDRNRVRTQLVNMYKEGYITEDELREELKALGFADDEIDLTVKEATLKYTYDYYSDLVKVIKEAFRKGQLTVEEAKEELRKIIKIEDRVNALVALWNLQLMPKPKIQSPPT